jgi:hypothetical protein
MGRDLVTLRDDQLPPKELWFGTTEGEWPLAVLHNVPQVIAWLEAGEPGRKRRAWRVVSYELGPELCVIRNQPILAEVTDAGS